MKLLKILKWFVAPTPNYSSAPRASSFDGYGRKALDPDWYNVENAFAIKCNGEPAFDIVGESFRQEALRSIVGDSYDKGVYWNVVAQLMFVEDNPHDPDAVGVFIDGKHVGFIPMDYSGEVRCEILNENPEELPVICKAMICGGFFDGSERAHYGVKIGLDLPIERHIHSKS